MSQIRHVMYLTLGLALILQGHARCTAGVPTGITFHRDSIHRSDHRGDNWCVTWAADGSQVTSMCDGNWLGGKQSYHDHLYRIVNGPDQFSVEDIPNYPQYLWGTRSWFGCGYAHIFPEKSKDGNYFSWYSWLPSVVWNQGLGLCIMVNGGTYGGHGMTSSDKDYYDAWMHTKTGSLGFWYSKHPYGPWQQIYYTDYCIADHERNRTYQPKLSPKWISRDGTQMILIW